MGGGVIGGGTRYAKKEEMCEKAKGNMCPLDGTPSTNRKNWEI